VQLKVSPGVAGDNLYEAWVKDYDTGDPLETVTSVELRCSLPTQPALGTAVVTLERQNDGSWAGRGIEFSIAGSWRVVMLVEEDTGGLTVPLTVTIRAATAEQ
jgi:hypothetical protein